LIQKIHFANIKHCNGPLTAKIFFSHSSVQGQIFAKLSSSEQLTNSMNQNMKQWKNFISTQGVESFCQILSIPVVIYQGYELIGKAWKVKKMVKEVHRVKFSFY
jgi:hypothetical protein